MNIPTLKLAAVLMLAMPHVWAAEAASVFAEPQDPPVVTLPPPLGQAAHKKSRHQASKKSPRPRLVKATPAPTLDLPGVMKIQGADTRATDFSRSRVIPFVNGSSRTVYVSATEPNLIQLPFEPTSAPATERLSVNPSGNNLFVSFDPRFAQDAKPAQLWIESPNHQVMGLQLVPSAIPAQPILLESRATYDSTARTQKGADSYVSGIQDLMQQVALGQAPEGYSAIDMQKDLWLPAIAKNGLVVQPRMEYSGDAQNLFVYEVTNPGAQSASVREDEFNGALVTAISIFPKPLLAPGESTQVLVLVDKESAR